MYVSSISELEDFNVIENNLLNQNNNDFDFWFKKIDTIYKKTVESSKFEYRKYQVEYAAIACLRRKNILAHSQGAGKTATAGLTIAALYLDIKHTRSRVHILVPNILAASRWLEDLNYIPSLVGLCSFISSISDFQIALDTNVPILIYTYDFLKKKYKEKNVAKYISKYERPSMVVIDELHNLSNPKIDRTKRVKILIRKVKRVLGLTGTISDGRLEQISAVCNLVYRSYWEYTDKQFVLQFARKRKIDTNYLTGASGETNRYLNELEPNKVSTYYNYIRKYLHRVTLDDPDVKSSISLPQQFTHVIELQLDPFIQSQYDSYINTYKQQLILLSSSQKSNNTRFQALQLLSPLIKLVNSPKEGYTSNKIKSVKEHIYKYKKVAIFTHRIESARYLEEQLKEYKTVRLYSSDETKTPKVMPMSARYEVVRQFQQDKNVRVGIFSVGLASESIDLTAGDAVIFYCLPWQSIKILQSITRVVRPGNLNPNIDVLYFCYQNAIDKHQVNLLLQKINKTKMLLDYDGIEVIEDINDDTDGSSLDVLSQIVNWL